VWGRLGLRIECGVETCSRKRFVDDLIHNVCASSQGCAGEMEGVGGLAGVVIAGMVIAPEGGGGLTRRLGALVGEVIVNT